MSSVAAAYAQLPGVVREMLKEVDAAGAFGIVEDLTALGEKLSGSKAEVSACDLITGKLREWGIDFQVHRFEALISHPVSTELIAPFGEIETGGAGFSASTPAGGIEAAVIPCPDNAIAGLDAGEVRGRILLAEGVPALGLAFAAQELGAAAVVFASTGVQCHKTELSPLWGAPTSPEQLDKLLRIPVVSIPAEGGRRLRQMQPDQTVRLTCEVETSWREIALPVAEIPGRDPHFLLAGAHYCTWYAGATDNASGAAILLEMARILSRNRGSLEFGVRFAWWPGHEQGEYAGSSWYADHNWMELHELGLGYHNLDIVGVRGGVLKAVRNQTADMADYTRRVVAAFAEPMSDKDAAFVAKALRREDKYVPADRVARNSDQSFCGIGLSSYQVSAFQAADSPDHLTNSGIAWWWQSAYDTIERCDPAELDRDIRINLALAAGLVCARVLPMDPAALAGDLCASIREYREAAPDLVVLGDLAVRARRLRLNIEAVLASPAGTAGRDAARLNGILLGIGRHLTPVLYHGQGRFHYDNGRRNRTLPGLIPALTLASAGIAQARLARLGILRAANRIALAMARAEGELDRWNSADGGDRDGQGGTRPASA